MLNDSNLKSRMDLSQVKTVWDILENNVKNYPDNVVGFVKDDGETHEITYKELHSMALAYSGGLRERGLKSGDKLILAFNKNEETIPILWACFAAGIVPTILQPPVSFSSTNPALEKIINVFQKLNHPYILVSDETLTKWDVPLIPVNKVISFSSLEQDDNSLPAKKPNEHDIAYIQFSSGSTGDPKGIQLSHRNLIKNIQAISIKFEHIPADVMVNWMPLYHDMGLIGFHFTIMVQACNQYHIDPVDFIKNPYLWLDMLSRKKGSVTGCPNFGQALVIRHLKRKKPENWNLENIKVVFNGAEPISTSIMNEFMELLAPYGFKKKAMMPVYGLAEATLAVSFSPLHEEPLITAFDRHRLQNLQHVSEFKSNNPAALEIVSVGKAIDHCEYIIADEEDKPLPEGMVGQVLIKGENITTGYFEDQEATEQVFSGPWLKTGDMGFIYEGNLYITGRYKDIIFIGGKNLYANDLEAIACRLEGVTYGKVVIGGAFDEKKGQDQVIVFLVGSPNPNTATTFKKLKELMQETLAMTVQIFIPVKSNEIPKTSSGKIQRYKLIERYLKGEFEDVINKTKALMKK